jgi:hypothetical protein
VNTLTPQQIETLKALPTDRAKRIALNNILVWWRNRTVDQTFAAYAAIGLEHLYHALPK